MTATDSMSDLYVNGSLITIKLSARAHQRYEQALWYCWGRQDAGDARTAGKLSAHYLGDDFGFAEMAALEAEEYDREIRCMLSNIGDQYARFVTELGA